MRMSRLEPLPELKKFVSAGSWTGAMPKRSICCTSISRLTTLSMVTGMSAGLAPERMRMPISPAMRPWA